MCLLEAEQQQLQTMIQAAFAGEAPEDAAAWLEELRDRPGR